MRVASLYRYPVKGLSPEPLGAAMLAEGGHFPGDRLYAIENGPSGFDPANPVHQPKIRYLMLMRDESLARLKTRYDDATRVLTIEHEGRVAAQGDLSSQQGRAEIEAFLERHIGARMRGPARALVAPAGYRFTDSRRGFVSLINLASVAALEPLVDAPVDPVRFRGNIYLDGMAAWRELDLVDATIAIGATARLKILKRIERCAATCVDPQTGARDLPIPRALMQAFNHTDCGVYAEVVAGGEVKPGDRLEIL